MKVSIIIPYKKDRGYLNEAIESVHKQTYSDIELIHAKGDNILSINANNGIKESTGDIIKLLSDDDWLPITAIDRMVRKFQEEPDIDFLHGIGVNMYDNRTQDTRVPSCTHPKLEDLMQGNHIHGGTTAYRRSFFDKFGMYDEELWTGEEFELHLRALSMDAKIGYIPETLYFYRKWEGQKSFPLHPESYNKARREMVAAFKNKYR